MRKQVDTKISEQRLVDEYCRISALIKALDGQKKRIESELFKIGSPELADSKNKSVKLFGSNKNTVTITLARTVSVEKAEMLRKFFGKAYNDFIKVEKTVKLTPKAKAMLGNIYKDEVYKQTIDEIIDCMDTSDSNKDELRKKCKGKSFEKDKENICAITGFSEQESSEYAYFMKEALAWREVLNLQEVNKWSSKKREKCLKTVSDLCTVTDTPKYTASQEG